MGNSLLLSLNIITMKTILILLLCIITYSCGRDDTSHSPENPVDNEILSFFQDTSLSSVSDTLIVGQKKDYVICDREIVAVYYTNTDNLVLFLVFLTFLCGLFIGIILNV
jgi:hypothetical protein